MDKEQLIANFFLDRSTDEEKKLIDSLLEEDKEFKKEFQFQKSVKQAIDSSEHNKIKEQLQDFESKFSNNSVKNTWWAIAATIFLMISTGLYLYHDTSSHKNLFSEYYEPAENIIFPIVRNSDEQSNENQAFIAYQKKDYILAQQLFRELFLSTKKTEYLFYEGITLIETNQLPQAAEKLETHKGYSDAVSEKTNWYLALTYLKIGDIEKTKSILNYIIQDSNNFYNKEAKVLLKKL